MKVKIDFIYTGKQITGERVCLSQHTNGPRERERERPNGTSKDGLKDSVQLSTTTTTVTVNNSKVEVFLVIYTYLTL